MKLIVDHEEIALALAAYAGSLIALHPETQIHAQIVVDPDTGAISGVLDIRNMPDASAKNPVETPTSRTPKGSKSSPKSKPEMQQHKEEESIEVAQKPENSPPPFVVEAEEDPAIEVTPPVAEEAPVQKKTTLFGRLKQPDNKSST